jgi:hypothetical protein
MKLKCPVCNSCFSFVWQKNLRFFWCDFCQHLYNLVDNDYKRVIGVKETEEGVKIFYEDSQ